MVSAQEAQAQAILSQARVSEVDIWKVCVEKPSPPPSRHPAHICEKRRVANVCVWGWRFVGLAKLKEVRLSLLQGNHIKRPP